MEPVYCETCLLELSQCLCDDEPWDYDDDSDLIGPEEGDDE